MPFQLSPGVLVVEKDFSAIVPAVSTSTGAYAGTFQWGPVSFPVTVSSENVLVERFGKPNDSNFSSFFTASNFLAYTNTLRVVRVDTANAKNAVSSGSAIKIKNADDYDLNYSSGEGAVGEFAAKYPGTLGNSLQILVCDSGGYNAWDYKALFQSAPGTSAYAQSQGAADADDELHIVVLDKTGIWTGTAGTVLEKFAFVSKASDAKKVDGSNNYYKTVINNTSKYIWWMDHTASVGAGTAWGSLASAAATTPFKSLDDDGAITLDISLTGGADDYAADDGDYQDGYALFADAEKYDISLIPLGNVSATVANFVISNVAEVRKDCVVFVSPRNITGGDPITNASATPIQDILDYKNAVNISTSYAVMDTGFKYQYDRYNDVYRWIPLNGDVAGLCARTDYTNDPWWSPGGMNRGQIKNCIRLAVNPTKTDRDELYRNGVNPIVTFPGEGTVLFGDKTMLAKPSAFDRINVRRLFIVLEKAIAVAAKFQLFEFNDSFTRAQFKNLVEPYLRDVQGRRGVIDFRVVCDDTNNTGEVIDRNEFVADIYIKPARSINFITLNFVAARTSVSFEELGA